MLDRRLQLRYVPRQPIAVAVQINGMTLAAQLADISQSGCLLALPLEGSEHLPPDAALRAVWTLAGKAAEEIDGRLTHLSPIRCQRGAGVRFEASQRTVVERLLLTGEAGAVAVRRGPEGGVLSVVGHLGFHMNRAFLHPIRAGLARCIDLNRCLAIDSAGLGLLRIAVDHGASIRGARGRVKELLQIAQIVQAAAA